MAMKLQQSISFTYTPPESVAKGLVRKIAMQGKSRGQKKGIEKRFDHLRLLVGHFDELVPEDVRISKG